MPLDSEPGAGSQGDDRRPEGASAPGARSEAGVSRSMAVVDGIDALDRSLGRLFVAIGVFDGLHLGHEYLLGELRREAGRRDARPAVITFDHHPDEILTGKAPPLLCDPAERLERLEAAGVGVTVVQTFDVALRETHYDAFIGGIADRVELAGFLMTPDSAFGYKRAGTPETVSALGQRLGFDVVVVPPFTLDSRPVSSSAIRAAIEAGDLALAARLLGRPYSVVGDPTGARVGIGTEVSFPMPVALPPTGDYGVQVMANGSESSDGLARVDGARLQITHGLDVPTDRRVAITFKVT